MKLFYIPVFIFLLSCSHHGDDTSVETTNLKIKVLKERGDSVEKANVARGNDK
ncbi:MAG: hypothetical protein H0W61_02345 [Bacteroidetes bacterium]|nr:hypothetical protein [Bacteroidota bacterium]